jgi:hypothetical protein
MSKKTIFITSAGLIRLDENNEPTGMSSERTAINRILRITEPVHIVYNKNDKRIELDAEEGDILVEFYESAFPNPILLIHSKEWSENLEKYDEVQQKAKEEWSEKCCNDAAV